MDRLRIGICDDEEMILKKLHGLVEQAVRRIGLEFEILAFSSGKDLLRQAEKLDLVFLDIEMPGLDGIEAGRMLCRINSECAIIMATGVEERYKEAFHVRALRFVTKPFDSSEIAEAIEACLKRRIGLKTVEAYRNRKPYQVCQREIAYVISYGSYVELMVRGKRFRKEASMEEMEKLLEPRLFSRADRKYLVNLGHVDDYKNGIVTVGEEKIKASRRRRKEFERTYIEFDLEYRGKL